MGRGKLTSTRRLVVVDQCLGIHIAYADIAAQTVTRDLRLALQLEDTCGHDFFCRKRPVEQDRSRLVPAVCIHVIHDEGAGERREGSWIACITVVLETTQRHERIHVSGVDTVAETAEGSAARERMGAAGG